MNEVDKFIYKKVAGITALSASITDFKYKKHPETLLGNAMGTKSFVNCYSVLNADKESYAGFPKGIPANTPFGTFFGRQSRHFLKDMGIALAESRLERVLRLRLMETDQAMVAIPGARTIALPGDFREPVALWIERPGGRETVRFADPDDPDQGLIFDGRTAAFLSAA